MSYAMLQRRALASSGILASSFRGPMLHSTLLPTARAVSSLPKMISLKKEFSAFIRRSDVRIGLLRETVRKIQDGEAVDVEKVLGTDDPEREEQWEELLKQLETEDIMDNRKIKKTGKERTAAQLKKAAEAPPSPEPSTPREALPEISSTRGTFF